MKNSLIVLMLVLATVAVVARMWEPTQERMGRECYQNLRELSTASSMYSCDWAGYYPESMEILTPEYLAEVPVCPTGLAGTYSNKIGPLREGEQVMAHWEPGPDDDVCRLSCSSEKHDPEWRARLNFIGY